MVHEITSYQELEELMQSIPRSQLVVLDCYAPWCGPCKNIAPLFEELSKEYNDVLFLKANVDKIEELSDKFFVSAMPTFVFLKDRAAISKMEGSNPSKLLQFITQNRM